VRGAFSILLDQWGNGAYLAAEQIGGQSVSRDHKGKDANDPVVPVKGAKQRDALAFLADHILSDRAFKFSPALLRRLVRERWYDGDSMFFYSGGIDYPINEEILGIQKIVLGQCLASDVLARLQNQELSADAGTEPLKMAEVFRALTDGVWSELANPSSAGTGTSDGKGRSLALSTIRRNLQREHLRRLCTMVLGNRRSPYDDLYGYVIFYGGGSPPADARSLARMHLRQIVERIDKTLGQKDLTIDDTTRAHLEESRHRVQKVLDAGLDVNEP
jgi:hypothetical protein